MRFDASAAVLLYERKAKSSLPNYPIVKCTYCPGAASNRGLWYTELKFIRLVRERDHAEQIILSIEVCNELVNELGNVQVRGFYTSRFETSS